jgi:hypothetical protein
MISLLFIIIVLIGLVFSIMTFVDTESDYGEVVWPVLAMITWLIAAISVFNLEWQVSVANTTGGITTSVVSYTGGWPIAMLFMLFAFIFVIYAWLRVLDYFQSRTHK